MIEWRSGVVFCVGKRAGEDVYSEKIGENDEQDDLELVSVMWIVLLLF